jgi:hypothetical protein
MVDRLHESRHVWIFHTHLRIAPQGVFGGPDGSVAVSTISSFEVADKRTGGNRPWKNIFTVQSAAFRSTITPEPVGVTIFTETYSVSSLDTVSGVRGRGD